jgi:O-antigen/teichoic acid export membrane protein
LQGVIAGLVVSAAVRWLLFNTALRKEAMRQGIQITMKGLFRESSVLVTFAVPASLAGVSALLAIWIANAFLVRQENGFTQMGLYAAANSLRALVLFVPALINGVGVSVINGFTNAHHLGEYRAAFWANFWITCASLIVGAAALALFGDALLSLFGRDFVGAHLLLNIMIAGAVVEGMGIAAYQIVQSRARMWLSLCLITLPRDFILVVLAWILVPQHGALGLAATYAISSGAALISVIVITLRIGLAHSPDGVKNHEFSSEAR